MPHPQLRGAPETPLIHLSSDFIRAKEYFEAIVTSSSDAICTTDTRGRIIYFSPGAERMIGTPCEDMIGRLAHELYADGRADAERIMRLLRRDGALRNHELVIKRRDGRYLCVSMSAALLRDRSGKVLGTLGISKDITPRVELERRLREISITDELTGLYNKRHLRERLADEAQRARRQRHRLSLLLIDLDGFKRVNDSLGHQAGDRMLRDFAEVLRRGIRGRVDAAFRYGGDEFVVLLPGQTTARALQIAKRLAEDTRKASGVEISYGAASLRRAGSASELLGTADERMYRMKRSGRRRRPG